MKAVEIRGLEALRARLARAAAPEPFKKALREEAEALAAELRREAPAGLAAGIEVKDVSQGATGSDSASERTIRPGARSSSAP